MVPHCSTGNLSMGTQRHTLQNYYLKKKKQHQFSHKGNIASKWKILKYIWNKKLWLVGYHKDVHPSIFEVSAIKKISKDKHGKVHKYPSSWQYAKFGQKSSLGKNIVVMHILVKSKNILKKYLSAISKYVFYKVNINGKLLAAWLIYFYFRWRYSGASLCSIARVLDTWGSHSNNVKSTFSW